MAQVSDVAMLPQHAMIGSAGGQETTHAAYDCELHPNENASQGLALTHHVCTVSSEAIRTNTSPFHAAEVADNIYNNADDLWKIPDDLVYLQDAYASLNKPFSVDDLDKLPKDETEWGGFLEKMT